MLLRWFSCVTLCWLVVVPSAALADEAKPLAAPTVVARVRSLDTVIDNIKLLVSLAGQENAAQQIEGLIKTKIGPNGLEGIDPKKPFGAYARVGKEIEDVAGAIMIPIANEKAFLGLLENLNFKVSKDPKGIYSFNPGLPVEISFRFAHQYAYVTALNLQALEPGSLIPPEKVFPARQTAALSATLRLDQVPEAAKKLALAQIEQGLEKAQDKKEPGETEKQHEFRVQVLKEIGQKLQAILEDGSEVTAELDINRKTNELVADFRLGAQARSKLASYFKELGQSSSLFGELRSADAAASGLVHFLPTESIRKSLEVVIDEALGKGLASITDEAKRKQAEILAKALVPTLKAGEIDAAFNLAGPGKNKHYNLVAGLKLKKGEALGNTVRDLAAKLLREIPPAEAAKIKLDAESEGDIKIHRLDIQSTYDPQARDLFGDNPLYVAFREDALFLALGEDALPAMQKALKTRAASSPLLQVEAALGRLAPILAKSDEQRAKARKLFADGDEGTVRLRLEGGQELRLSLSTRLSVVQALWTFSQKRQSED